MNEGVFHLELKTVKRSDGRTATGAAAYRSASRIVDEKTGLVFDYRNKRGVVESHIMLPKDAPASYRDRTTLWNAAEESETRKNSVVAREFVGALPHDITPEARSRIAQRFVAALVESEGVAADLNLHAPHDADSLNWHFHVEFTTRTVGPDGFGEKTREWDVKQTGSVKTTHYRQLLAELTNEEYRLAGANKFVDHRSHADRGLDIEPTKKVGVAGTAMERRGEVSDRAEQNRAIRAANAAIEQAKQEYIVVQEQLAQVTLPAPAPTRETLQTELNELSGLKDKASTYGRAVEAYREQASQAEHFRKLREETKPPRWAFVHQFLHTDAWEQYEERLDTLEMQRKTAELKAERLKKVAQEHKQFSDLWDRTGYFRMREVEQALDRLNQKGASGPVQGTPAHQSYDFSTPPPPVPTDFGIGGP